MPNLRALDTSSWARRRVLGFRAHAQQLVMLFIDGGLGGVQLGAQLVQLGQQVVLGGRGRVGGAPCSGVWSAGSWGAVMGNPPKEWLSQT